MRNSVTLSVGALTMACVLGGCWWAPPVEEAVVEVTTPVRILRDAAGNDPACKQVDAMLIRSQAQFDELASDQLGELYVDFASEMLVVVALGERPTSGYAVKITNISRSGRVLFVQGTTTRPNEGDITLSMLTYPYAAAVIALSDADRIEPEID